MAPTSQELIGQASTILSDDTSVIQSRPLLTEFVKSYSKLEDNNLKIEVGTHVVQLLQPKIVSYEQQDSDLKFALAAAHEAEEDFVASAKVLQTITLDSSQRNISDDEKAQVWMRICRCYLEEDDPTSALTFLNKVKQVIYSVQNQETRLQFQLSQARISDSQRNFLDASVAYLALSNETVIEEEERLHSLSAAITCAVLAPAGPMRGRQLGKIYKDDRAIDTPEYGILEKIFLDRLLSPEEVSAFAAGLKEHQLAKTSDGSTVLDRAILEHNLLAVSHLYANIRVAALGTLLGVSADKAEAQAATMMETNRLSGTIDQIEGVIHFNQARGIGLTVGSQEGEVELRSWETNVQGLAEEVEKVTTMLQREEAAFYEANMVA